MNRLGRSYLKPIVLAVVVWFLAVHNFIWLAFAVVIAAEWPVFHRRPTRDELLAIIPSVIFGLSSALIIGLLPRALSQLAIAIGYAAGRIALEQHPKGSKHRGWIAVAAAQIVVFEALFLWAAIDNAPRVIVLILLFVTSFVIVFGQLKALGERAAAVLAVTWAVITVEAAWVFLTWLVSYVIVGGYFVVPQPTIILSGLGYCAGSIYLAGKRGELSRARLGEYMIITFVLILVVVAGTQWRGTI